MGTKFICILTDSGSSWAPSPVQKKNSLLFRSKFRKCKGDTTDSEVSDCFLNESGNPIFPVTSISSPMGNDNPISPVIPMGSPLEFDNIFPPVTPISSPLRFQNTDKLLDSELYKPKINVNKATVNKSGKRARKGNFCRYCLKEYAKLPRHIKMAHKDEEEVVNIMRLTNISEQKHAWEKVRNMGNYMKNLQTCKKGFGTIRTKRLIPQNTTNNEDSEYLPCPGCKAYLKKSYLYRHKTKCSAALNNNFIFDKMVVNQAKRTLGNITKCNSSAFESSVLNKMERDDIFYIINNDNLIKQFGENLFQTANVDNNIHHYVSQKMRELGKFLQSMRTVTQKEKSLMTCFIPKEVSNVITAIKETAGYIGEQRKFKTPTLAKKIGHNLNRCLEHAEMSAAEKEDSDTFTINMSQLI